jgi:hypothetical protein
MARGYAKFRAFFFAFFCFALVAICVPMLVFDGILVLAKRSFPLPG